MIRMLSLVVVLAVSGGASAADDLIAMGAFTPDVYRIDSATGAQALVGSVTLTASNEIGLSALARDDSGVLWGLSAAPVISQIANPTARLYLVDESAPSATLVSEVGTGVPVGAAIDPTDGSLWFLLTFTGHPVPTLNRYDFGSGTVTFLQPVSNALFLEALVGLAFDANGQLYSLSGSGAALWKIDKTDPGGAGSSPVGTGLGLGIDLTSGGSLASDPGSGGLLGYESAGRRFFIVDAGTGVGQLKSTMAGADVFGMAPIGCAATYGPGCPGVFGIVPRLSASGCAASGGPFQLTIEDGLGGSLVALLFGTGQGALPLGFGCDVVVAPLLPPVLLLPLGGVGPGQGSAVLGAVVPLGVPSGTVVTMQALVADPNVGLGLSATNGLRLEFL